MTDAVGGTRAEAQRTGDVAAPRAELTGYVGEPGGSGFARRIPASITTRNELIDALSVAASLEHAILLQYLYTAWTLKRRPDEGLHPKQERLMHNWGQTMLRVSHEEMIHLGIITNLLNVVGAAPVLHRPNFPQALSPESPFGLSLTKWDDHTLWRYERMELPRGVPLPPEPERVPDRLLGHVSSELPNVIEFDYLGELYDIIRAGFVNLGEDAFLVPAGVDTDTKWGLQVRSIPAVTDLESALAALDLVVEQGEGAPDDDEDSHYALFQRLRREFAELPAGFVPTRDVVDNPRTWANHRDSPLPGTYIENELTRRVAAVSNDAYRVLTLLMLQMFSYDEPPASGPAMLVDRELVKSASKQLMSSFIRAISEILTEMPVYDDPADGVAGVPFEVYEEVRLSPRHEPRFTIVMESLTALENDCKQLAGEAGIARLATLAEHAGWLRRNLAEGVSRAD
ncbi:ferritin-like domain-containing protein [Prauserella cavernicola]|uniref:Iminophenyl-pyruvate dimer synthase domain-containing protein n=1 Tax=Prauserella cavernicola TaxID=2800127 RepID=A0A934V828_9PSEU|nr:ferritin-like domain-containing protein [Prauserella cavernicola]MBK1787870.1 hypothetical protein [Prauserella cavernicola]